jgi:hypothetical protein
VTDETSIESRYLAVCDSCADKTELSVSMHVVAYAELTAFLAAHQDCERLSVRLTIAPQTD